MQSELKYVLIYTSYPFNYTPFNLYSSLCITIDVQICCFQAQTQKQENLNTQSKCIAQTLDMFYKTYKVQIQMS